MWKKGRGRTYLTDVAKRYYEHVGWAVKEQGKIINLDMPLAVHCKMAPPDRKRRDLENAWKVISDSLTRAHVWQDDSLVRRLTLEWEDVQAGGLVRVSIQPLVENSVS